MLLVRTSTVLAALIGLSAAGLVAQETSSAVAGGGISAPGWSGKIDANEQQGGHSLNDAKFTAQGDTFTVKTGPAVAYWKTGEQATGDYTVKATFTEPKYMSANTHPHPYGIVIAGNDMGTPQQSYLYCAAYGSGNFIVRGFGPDAFQMNGRRGEANPVVHKAAGPGESVSQDIAISVKGGRVECSINGTVVAGYDKAALVTAGKLKSTDGAYGLRFAHNTEVTVTGFGITKP